MKRLVLVLLLFCFAASTYAQSISFFDLTNLTNLSDGQAHTYLTLGKVFKHQYQEVVNGKKIEHFRSINPKEKEQTVTIGVNTVLQNQTVLRSITYTTLDPQHVVNMISQAKRSKMTLKFQGVNQDNNIFIFDNEFYRIEMFISTSDNRGMVKINQKEFVGY
ncbi:hypothetical protein [Mucilaginibacter glaciei]|uniref:DUF4252 domain-containing protein n=1 Tax=Mucilaginibacter glaciei TaxID=2772109 RepID=A0A926NK30_9SPHI|nr:hypothetical protein [Mucilaginibacter glaciei]MBD1392676.1 hypothetical protein [Mucilaginibacter glaciei]